MSLFLKVANNDSPTPVRRVESAEDMIGARSCGEADVPANAITISKPNRMEGESHAFCYPLIAAFQQNCNLTIKKIHNSLVLC